MSNSKALDDSWWDILEDARCLLDEAEEMLSGDTLSSEKLDHITSSIKSCHEAIQIANNALGLSD